MGKSDNRQRHHHSDKGSPSKTFHINSSSCSGSSVPAIPAIGNRCKKDNSPSNGAARIARVAERGASSSTNGTRSSACSFLPAPCNGTGGDLVEISAPAMNW
jgi:hypothetical protein